MESSVKLEDIIKTRFQIQISELVDDVYETEVKRKRNWCGKNIYGLYVERYFEILELLRPKRSVLGDHPSLDDSISVSIFNIPFPIIMSWDGYQDDAVNFRDAEKLDGLAPWLEIMERLEKEKGLDNITYSDFESYSEYLNDYFSCSVGEIPQRYIPHCIMLARKFDITYQELWSVFKMNL